MTQFRQVGLIVLAVTLAASGQAEEFCKRRMLWETPVALLGATESRWTSVTSGGGGDFYLGGVRNDAHGFPVAVLEAHVAGAGMQWSRSFGRGSVDQVLLLPGGDIVVGGWLTDDAGTRMAFLMRLSPDGRRIWNEIGWPGRPAASVRAVLTHSGELVILYATDRKEWFLAARALDGATRWSGTSWLGEEAVGVTNGTEARLIVAGHGGPTDTLQPQFGWIRVFTAGGEPLWSRSWTSGGSPVTAVAADDDGRICVIESGEAGTIFRVLDADAKHVMAETLGSGGFRLHAITRKDGRATTGIGGFSRTWSARAMECPLPSVQSAKERLAYEPRWEWPGCLAVAATPDGEGGLLVAGYRLESGTARKYAWSAGWGAASECLEGVLEAAPSRVAIGDRVDATLSLRNRSGREVHIQYINTSGGPALQPGGNVDVLDFQALDLKPGKVLKRSWIFRATHEGFAKVTAVLVKNAAGHSGEMFTSDPVTIVGGSATPVAARSGRERFAVLDVEIDSGSASDGGVIHESFRTSLAAERPGQAVERDRIREVFSQQALQSAVCMETECAVQLGRLLSASAVWIGRYGVAAGRVHYIVRAIEVESGEVVHADRVSAPDAGELRALIPDLARRCARWAAQPSE